MSTEAKVSKLCTYYYMLYIYNEICSNSGHPKKLNKHPCNAVIWWAQICKNDILTPYCYVLYSVLHHCHLPLLFHSNTALHKLLLGDSRDSTKYSLKLTYCSILSTSAPTCFLGLLPVLFYTEDCFKKSEN